MGSELSKRNHEAVQYTATNLLSCMTLDVKHFHSTTLFKREVMSYAILPYFWKMCEGKRVCVVIGVHNTLRIPTIGIRCQDSTVQLKDMSKL